MQSLLQNPLVTTLLLTVVIIGVFPLLAGYIVLRGVPPSGTMAPVTPMPIQVTTLRDPVPPGVRYVYAVEAVDKAGNTSMPSSRSEETEAR